MEKPDRTAAHPRPKPDDHNQLTAQPSQSRLTVDRGSAIAGRRSLIQGDRLRQRQDPELRPRVLARPEGRGNAPFAHARPEDRHYPEDAIAQSAAPARLDGRLNRHISTCGHSFSCDSERPSRSGILADNRHVQLAMPATATRSA